MIILSQIEQRTLETAPYGWAFVRGLFAEVDATALMATFPRDHFKTIKGDDGEKSYEYEARSLVSMGTEAPTYVGGLSPAWRRLADDLLSPSYRIALTKLVKQELSSMPMEVNVFHYGPGAWLGPHVDLKDKLFSHIFYFNEAWQASDGGSLTILRSKNMSDAVASILPVIGNSVVLVRSDQSWHAVPRLARHCKESRRSMAVTFYRPGSVSTMWPPEDKTPLHDYDERKSGLWAGWRAKLR